MACYGNQANQKYNDADFQYNLGLIYTNGGALQAMIPANIQQQLRKFFPSIVTWTQGDPVGVTSIAGIIRFNSTKGQNVFVVFQLDMVANLIQEGNANTAAKNSSITESLLAISHTSCTTARVYISFAFSCSSVLISN